MLGAVIGDVIGSAYEAVGKQSHLPPMKDINFELFTENSRFTDDTVCTLAIAEAVLHRKVYKGNYQTALLHWSRRYPNSGFGGFYKEWMNSKDPQPYNSWGNGSAMRVSPIGFAFAYDHLIPYGGGTLEKVVQEAEASALPTHGHPEGIKAAKAVASAIAMARTGYSKRDIKEEIAERYSYDLTTTLAKIRPTYKFDVTCQGSVPQAIRCFLESEDFESAIRNAVSLGGDTDTQACMAGAIAQAFYKKIPEKMVLGTFERLPPHFIDLILRFHDMYGIEF